MRFFFFYFMSSHFYKPQQFSQTTLISRNIIAVLIYHIHLISKRQHITYWYLPSYTRGFSFYVDKFSYNFPKFEAHIKHHFCIDTSTFWLSAEMVSPIWKHIRFELWLLTSLYFQLKTWSKFFERNTKQNVIPKNRIGMTLILFLFMSYGVRVHAIFRCTIIHKVGKNRKWKGN